MSVETNRPEPILTAEQWATIHRLATRQKAHTVAVKKTDERSEKQS